LAFVIVIELFVRAAVILDKAYLAILVLDHVLEREETAVVHSNTHLEIKLDCDETNLTVTQQSSRVKG